jgi:hypothetical protein
MLTIAQSADGASRNFVKLLSFFRPVRLTSRRIPAFGREIARAAVEAVDDADSVGTWLDATWLDATWLDAT